MYVLDELIDVAPYRFVLAQWEGGVGSFPTFFLSFGLVPAQCLLEEVHR